MTSAAPETADTARVPAWAVFAAFLRLGLTSFGGPVAHLGYFREAFVVRRRWIGEGAYADLVALCQILPGPASSQVGMGIGLAKAGLAGALAAWAGFTLPSALAMIAFGLGVTAYRAIIPVGVLHGLKVAAVAVVAQAVVGMARSLCPDWPRRALAVGAALVAFAWPTPLGQLALLAAGGLCGAAMRSSEMTLGQTPLGVSVPRGAAPVALALFGLLLVGLPVLASIASSESLAVIDRFYRCGALVFGGGHVVLPLLQAAVVPPGWVDDDLFLAGYGAAQAVPGPLFTFAAFLGTVMGPEPHGWRGGLLTLGAIFAPSFLLIVGVLPFWERLRGVNAVRRALPGVNAAVVGLLLAALVTPVATSALTRPADGLLALAAFAGLVLARAPPWAVVLLTAACGWGLSRL